MLLLTKGFFIPSSGHTPELDATINAWNEFLTPYTQWQSLIAGKEPHLCGCGTVYELPNYLQRPSERLAIADMRAISYTEPHYHPHPITEIYYVLQGSCVVVVCNQIYPASTGTVIVIPPATAHYILDIHDCVLAVVNKPPLGKEHYIPLAATDPNVAYNHEQFLEHTRNAR